MSSFVANPSKDGLQVMFIILTIYKYNINDGFIMPILDEYMPKTSSVQSYSTTAWTMTCPRIVHQVYTKHSESRGHQTLVLLRMKPTMIPFSMGPDEEALARIIFKRYD